MEDYREAGTVNRRNNFGPAGKPTDNTSCTLSAFPDSLGGYRVNTAKIREEVKVYHNCILNDRIFVPYLIDEIKSQFDRDTAKALLNRVYYNIRVGRMGCPMYGVLSLHERELERIGIYIKERKK